jgi:hypothetical protein
MTEREMLEFAAQAAGIELGVWSEYRSDGIAIADSSPDFQKYDRSRAPVVVHNYGFGWIWNPLTNDGDAQRLAVKLGLSIDAYPIYSEPKHSVIVKQRRRGDMMREANPTEVIQPYGDDPAAAWRRAIVRSAAEIGRSKA